MSGQAILVMGLICGFVWGGFGLLLTQAIRRESVKGEHGRGPSP